MHKTKGNHDISISKQESKQKDSPTKEKYKKHLKRKFLWSFLIPQITEWLSNATHYVVLITL